MYKKRGKLKFTAVMTAVLITSASIPVHKVFAAPGVDRLSGADRYKTSLQIVSEGWDVSRNLVLVSGEDFPDGLSAAPLAKQLNAPVLLINGRQLDTDTLNKIKSLLPQKIFIIGGEGVISKTLEDYFKNSLGVEVIRLSGNDRYETSIKVADYMYSNFNMSKEIAVASGENFPDALSMAPVAAIKDMPMILTSKSQVTSDVKDFTINNNITKSYIVGGPGVISDEVVSEFPGSQRIWGNDRYETNLNIMKYFSDDLQISGIFVASGENFPDALGGAALVAKYSAPIFLVSPQPDQATEDYIYNFTQPNSPTGRLYVLGGTGVVSDNVINNLLTKKRPTNQKVTIGSTIDEVLEIMGEPAGETNYFAGTYDIYYNNDVSIKFTTETTPHTVISWSNHGGDTRISIGEKNPNAAPITLGSGLSDIAAAVGTPYAVDKYIDYSIWRYPNDSILYVDSQNKVVGWVNKGNLKIYMGEKDPTAPGIKKGSTVQDVVKAMGTPEEINFGIYFSRSMKYGNSYIGIDDNGSVTDWVNNGELKLASQ